MKRLSFGSLRLRLIILVLIATIPALVITLYSGFEQRKHVRQMVLDDARRLAQDFSATHDRLILNARQILFTLSKTSEVQQQDKAACSNLFADIVKQSEGYTALVAAKPNGDLFASSKPITSPINFSDRPWFQRLLKTRDFVIGEYLIGRVSGKPIIVLAHPVFDGTGNLKALLNWGMDLEWLNNTVAKSKFQEGTSVSVIDSGGTILFRYPEHEKFVGKSTPEVPIIKAILAKREGVEEAIGLNGLRHLYGFTSLGMGVESVHMAVGIPKQIALARVDRVMKQNLAYLGLIALLALTAAWFMGGFFIIHPVNRLLETTKRIEGGDLTARAGPSYGNGEIGQLAYAFDQMAESLKKRETERKQAQETLRESEEKYRTLISNIPGMIYRGKPDWSAEIILNSEKVCGYLVDEFKTQKVNWIDLIHPDDKQRVFEEGFKLLERPLSIVHEYGIFAKDGSTRWVRDHKTSFFKEDGSFIGVDGIVYDITEHKRSVEDRMALQEQLLQSGKMEAIGTLAGGIAHDFNNILTAIIGNADLALMSVGKDDTLREEIEEIRIAGKRAAVLTRQLLAFSRKQIIQPKILDLNELLTDIEKMLGRLIGEDVEILIIPESAIRQVEMDPGQMEQVIMNLVINARDAMPDGGKLTIEVANADLDRSYFRKRGIKKEQPGAYVMLAVSDTGIGMDKETQERIFEPFFTTKEIGKGTGLGLATVYGIVTQNNGFIWACSEPGQGATFKIYLPTAEGDAVSEEKEQYPVTALGGSETVLIVEDDNLLRNLAQKSLQPYGYRVLAAENGEEALRVSKEHDGPIHLMITDVVMPKMSGKETAERLQPHYPQMRVIYMSGYTDNAIVHHGVLEPGLNFLEKPFTPEGLARKVREVLDKKQG